MQALHLHRKEENNMEPQEEIVTQSPVPQKKQSTLSFPDALVDVIDGRKITKLEWNDTSIFGFLGTDGHLKLNLPDKLSDWILSEADLKGVDWIVLEEAK